MAKSSKKCSLTLYVAFPKTAMNFVGIKTSQGQILTASYSNSSNAEKLVELVWKSEDL